MDKVKDAELTGIIKNGAINQPKIDFQVKNGIGLKRGSGSHSVQHAVFATT